jgi:hypothetical protein
MKRKYWVLLLVCAVFLNIAPALADGDFYVVAVGGGVGTKITSLPKTITTPGFYYVAGNLTCPSGNGIIVSSDDVTIDLMGFCLSGNGASHGISGTSSSVEIRNGTLRGWNHAIDMWGTHCRIINLRAQGNAYGINLGTNGGHLIKGCALKDNSDTGIFASDSTISNNVVTGAAGAFYGIVGDGIISGNRVTGPHKWGIFCTGPANIIGNTVYSSSGDSNGGIILSAVEPNFPTVMDQNTVYGPGPHYLGGTSAVIWAGKSTFNTWGSNAGH